MEIGYYKANTSTGVYYYGDILDEPDTEVMKPLDFLGSLKGVQDGEELTTFFGLETEEIYNQVDSEYGIH